MVLEDLFRRPSALVRFRLPPLGPMMDGFCDWLGRQGFCRSVVRRRVWQTSHFSQYLRRQGIKNPEEVDKSHAERFIRKHLPRCRCAGGRRRKHGSTPSSVRSFIDYLSRCGLLACPSPPSSPYQELLQEYLDSLKCERNLAERTLKAHREGVTAFLEELGNPPAERLRHMSPEQILAFFTHYTQDRGPHLRRCLQGVLRSFLRFCRRRGYVERDLAEAVPRIRTFKLSGVPRAISEEDAHKTLQCIDRTKRAGRRDAAIIQLLHAYGVRGGQVRSLKLPDLQWRKNRIRFPPYKGGKELIVPLTDEVGESLLDYLRHERPQAPYPEVFLTAQSPVRPLRCSSTVSLLVRQRMRRAGVSTAKAGSHVFRHGFATRMLQHGQSLKTIADLMGHRNINTTFIYTKVDFHTLQQVPLDWPEGAP